MSDTTELQNVPRYRVQRMLGTGDAYMKDDPDGGWVDRKDYQSLLDENARLKAQSIPVALDDIKLLLSFAPKDCPEGLDPTFYNTLTYEGDRSIQDRIEAIQKAIGEVGQRD